MPEQKTSGFRDDRGENLEQEIETGTPAVAANGTVEHTIYSDDRDTTSAPGAQGVDVRSVEYAPDATLTGAATNFPTITVEQYAADGTHKATLGTVAFSSAPVTAPANRRLALVAPGTHQLAVGDYLTFKVVQAGTGIAVPAGIAVVRYAEF